MKRKTIISTILLALSSANAFSNIAKTNSLQSTRLSQLPKYNGRRSAFDFSKSTSTELKVSATPVGAVAGILTGGLFAGGLHAIAGKLKKGKFEASRRPLLSYTRTELPRRSSTRFWNIFSHFSHLRFPSFCIRFLYIFQLFLLFFGGPYF